MEKGLWGMSTNYMDNQAVIQCCPSVGRVRVLNDMTGSCVLPDAGSRASEEVLRYRPWLNVVPIRQRLEIGLVRHSIDAIVL